VSLQMVELKDLYDQYLCDPKFQHFRDVGRKFVAGAGPLKAKAMFIGEAPGRMENSKSMPFVGPAGGKLVDLLEDVKINTDHVFFTNVVKYWPLKQADGSYTPTEDEISASRDYLMKEIEIVQPLVIGMCGRTAIHAIFPELTDVFHSHGNLIEGKFVPVYHPAVLLYQPWRKTSVREGYIKLAAYLATKDAA
jgi:uracil-DNA glycosylase